MSLSHRNQVPWLVYIKLGNLDAKMRWSQHYLGTLLLGSIPIVYERAEDSNNKDKDLRARFYHFALKTMFKHT